MATSKEERRINPFAASWEQELCPEDMPEVYREISAAIGIRHTMALAGLFAGHSVYFPRLDRSFLPARNRAIRQEFDGANIRELARRFGLSSRHVRQIVTKRTKN